jgi:predicted TIM-barrel fold metal-dependent hydrolase
VVIDTHVHLYPPEVNTDPEGWARFNRESHWARLATRVRKNGRPVQSFPTLEQLLAGMDGAGIGRAVLLGWYWEQAESCVRQNRFYAQCVRRHPDRLAAAVTIQPRAGTRHVEDELSWAQQEGFRAVGELSPHSQGYAIDDAAFEFVLRQAGTWKWPVNLHVTAPDARPYSGMVPTPLPDFVRLAEGFPGTDFILAHFGGAKQAGVGADCARPNIYFDSAAWPLSYGHEIWQRFPPGRVIFGSDFPLNSFPALDAEPSLRRLIEGVRSGSGLGPAEQAAVLGGTAKRWFSVNATI